MPSVWEVAGEALGGTILAPIVIGGVIVTAIASPEVRQRMRRIGVRGMAAALAARDAAQHEFEATAGGSGGLAVQIGHRIREAVTEVREDWDDFVAEAKAERERRWTGSGRRASTGANGETAVESSAPSAARRRARPVARRSRRAAS